MIDDRLPAHRVHLRLLGSVAVAVGATDATAALSHPKRLALITWLVMARPYGLHRRDTLCALFWPESPGDNARAALRQLLQVLRRELGEHVLITEGDLVGLDSAVLSCDVRDLLAAFDAGDDVRAVDLYAGELLPGLHVPEADGFERWLEEQRGQLHRMVAQAAWRLVDRTEAAGEVGEALRRAERAVAIDPENEAGLRHLLALEARTGDRAAALRTFEQFERRLKADWGTGPEPSTLALVEQIRSGLLPHEGAAVHQSASAENEGSVAQAGAPSALEQTALGVTRPKRRLWLWLAGAGLAGGTAIVAAVGGMAWIRTRGHGPTSRIERLAVLPLVNGTADSTVSAVSEALTQELISALLGTGIRVVGYYTVAPYSGRSVTLGQVGTELDVDAVATWVVRRQGDRLRVSLEVARPRSGDGLWSSSRFDVDSLRLTDVASGAARELAAHFAPNRPRPERRSPVGRSSTSSPEAKLAYLIGMQNWFRGADRLDFAMIQFQRSVAVDPSFAPAWAAQGLLYAMGLDGYSPMTRDDACKNARSATGRALALDSALALAHLARARTLHQCDWNWSEAEVEYRRAIALEPSAIAYQTYGWFLEWYLGRTREGVAHGDTSVQIDPGSAHMHGALGWRLRGAGQLDRADEEARIALALDPLAVEAHHILAEVSLRRGDYVTAEREALAYRAIRRNPASATTLGEVYARTGRIHEARAYMKELVAQHPLTGPARVALARTQMALGERDAALTTLELAVRDHVFIVPFQPYWDPLRNEPRFQALLRQMGL